MANDVENGRNIDILLVEDKTEDIRRIELMLHRNQDLFQLHKVKSVKSAYQLLSNQPIQVILLNMTLPDCDGAQTVRALHTHFPRIPIVVLTGLDDEQMVSDAATAGAQDYLVKEEITPTGLWRVLRYALERRSQEEELHESQRAYRRQARELNVLNRIISAAAASNDQQAILDTTCFELAQFYDALRAMVLLRPRLDAVATVQAQHSHSTLPALPKELIGLNEEEALTAVLTTQHTLVFSKLTGSFKHFLAVPDYSQFIIHPLNVEEETIGFFVLVLPETYALAVSDVRLLAMVADEVELGLTKIRLYGRLQAHAHQLEERVQERTQALAEANKQLKSLDKLKSKFVSDVSHELRNPITNLSLYLELLEFAPPQKQSQYITILRTQMRRLSSLVEEILTLSRLEHNQHNQLFQPVDLNYLTQQVVVAHTPRAKSKQIKLKFRPTAPLPAAWGDANQITQIITNLLDNALNYTARGSIWITTNLSSCANQPELELSVIDTGLGIPEIDLPHIYERFYRGAKIDRKTMMGTGLGLAIVSEIVARHNGRISVSSSPNKGSTFTITLPTAPKE